MPTSKAQIAQRREQVKKLLIKGFSQKQIAQRLECHKNTINRDVQFIQKSSAGISSKEVARLKKAVAQCDRHIKRILAQKHITATDRNLLTSLQKQRADYQGQVEVEEARLGAFREELKKEAAKQIRKDDSEINEPSLGLPEAPPGTVLVEDYERIKSIVSRRFSSASAEEWVNWPVRFPKALWDKWSAWCQRQNQGIKQTVGLINAECNTQFRFQDMTNEAWIREIISGLIDGEMRLGITEDGKGQIITKGVDRENAD